MLATKPPVLRDQQDRREHEQRDREVVERCVVRVRDHLADVRRVGDLGEKRRPAHRPADAHAHQADADDRDDRAGHDRRKEAQHPARDRCEHDADHAGRDDRAEQRPRRFAARHRLGDRDHRADGREGHAHHHRQLDAEPLRHAPRLDQRDQPAAEQVGRDQQRHLLRRKLQRTPDDQRHGNGAGVHHEHVLEAERRQARRGQAFVHRVDGCRLSHRCLLRLDGRVIEAVRPP